MRHGLQPATRMLGVFEAEQDDFLSAQFHAHILIQLDAIPTLHSRPPATLRSERVHRVLPPCRCRRAHGRAAGGRAARAPLRRLWDPAFTKNPTTSTGDTRRIGIVNFWVKQGLLTFLSNLIGASSAIMGRNASDSLQCWPLGAARLDCLGFPYGW